MIPGNRQKAKSTKDILVVGVFMVTVINVFATAFTTTDKLTAQPPPNGVAVYPYDKVI